MQDWTKLIELLDQRIRAGNGKEASILLERAVRKKPPRRFVPDLAGLARRCGKVDLAMRLLYPFVRASTIRAVDPSPEERLEYAACLHRIGANYESQELLRSIDANAYPKALLFQSFALVGGWDYASAIPLLRDYVQRVNGYSQAVGNVNLLAALVYERQHEAVESLTEELLQLSKESTEFRFIRGKVLQLVGSDRVLRGEPEAAVEALQSARQLLNSTGAIEEFLVRKWLAFSDYAQSRSRENQLKIEAVRAEAVGRNHWESVRDCDRFRAIQDNNLSLATKVWFGTPFPSFRRWLDHDFPLPKETIRGTYLWAVGTESTDGTPDRKEQVDLDALSKKRASARSQTQLSIRLLSALCQDFYRPLSLGQLHQLLHPGQFFNPQSSPGRIQMAVQRLRSWFSSEELPLDVRRMEGVFRLEAIGPCFIRLHASDSTSSPLDEILHHFGMDAFSARQAADFLGISIRTAIRLLNDGLEEKRLERSGIARGTRYRGLRSQGALKAA